MPFNFFQGKSNIDFKSRLEKKLVLGREDPEPIFDVSDCNLSSVPSSVFPMCKVLRKEVLFLHVVAALKKIGKYLFLNNENNQLSSLRSAGNLEDLSLLKILDVHCNKLTSLPENIDILVNLEVLNISDNKLSKLPDAIGNLTRLQGLLASNNKLSYLPSTLCHCVALEILNVEGNRNLSKLPAGLDQLPNLKQLHADLNISFHINEIQNTAASSRLNEMGVASSHDKKEKCDPSLSSEYFLIEERLKLIEEKKEAQQRDRLAVEKSLAEECLKQFEIHQEQDGKRRELVGKILTMEDGLEKELNKIQCKKDQERARLIEECSIGEKRINEKVSGLLSNWKTNQDKLLRMSEEEQEMEKQLLFGIQCKNNQQEREKILDAMQDLVKEEVMKAEQFKKYESQRDKDARTWLARENSFSSKLSDIVNAAQSESQTLVEAISADEELQKTAVASLLEQSDIRSFQLAQQVALVQTQLAELTQIEMAKRKLESNTHIEELCHSRVALSQHLMELFAQQASRQQVLVESFRRMEAARDGDSDQPGEAYWLGQYERLLLSSARQVIHSMQQVPIDLHQLFLFHCVAHYLPVLAQHLTNDDDVKQITDQMLQDQCGISDADDRCLIMKAITTYLRHETPVPSAPPEEALRHSREPSAPPLDDDMDVVCAPAGAFSQLILAEECVVCLCAEVGCIFIPCGHMCCCRQCSVTLTACPLCRSSVQQHVFYHQPIS